MGLDPCARNTDIEIVVLHVIKKLYLGKVIGLAQSDQQHVTRAQYAIPWGGLTLFSYSP